jgi:hypothetical protein
MRTALATTTQQQQQPKVTGTVRSKNPLKGAVEILPVRSFWYIDVLSAQQRVIIPVVGRVVCVQCQAIARR